jgi:hypothetical protein
MTKVFVTFPMLPKIGWAEPTRQKNPGAASIHVSQFALISARCLFNATDTLSFSFALSDLPISK